MKKLTNSIFPKLLGEDKRLATIADVNLVITELNRFSTTQAITAYAGGGQTNATGLIVGINIVTSATDGNSVHLPCCSDCTGSDAIAPVVVKNVGPGTLSIYPCAGFLINDLAINTPLVLAAGSSIQFNRVSTLACPTCTDKNWTSYGYTPVAPIVPGAPAAASVYSMFYGLTAGTGNPTSTDYAATIAVKTTAGTGRVPFPRNGPTSGSITSAIGSTSPALIAEFNLPAIGTYEVTFRVHTTEPGQLQLELNGTALEETTAGNANPTSGGHPIVGNSFITTTVINSKLAVINPAGNTPALTITPADGASTHTQAQTLTIKQIA